MVFAEYLAIRHQNQVESRQLREKAAMLEADHARMQRELKEVQIKAAAEIKEVRKQASAESDHLTSHNRLIARQREDDLAMLKVRRLRCARCRRLGAHGHARCSPCFCACGVWA